MIMKAKEIGYKITFQTGDSITIKHGNDGVDGKDGKDGNDGYNGVDGVTLLLVSLRIRMESIIGRLTENS